MQLIRGQHRLTSSLRECVVTLGNFDGFHRGHGQLISTLKQLGERYQVPTVLITFEPQPKEFFAKQQTVPRLMRFREKWWAAEAAGLDYVLCLRFTKEVAALSPESFVKDILVDQLGVKAVVVGDDFCFGAKRAGTFSTLERLGKQHGFVAQQIPPVMASGKRISSTSVRDALQAGDLALAEQLLGRPYSLCGNVAYGDQRGRDLGYPTANVHLHRALVPVSGIFAIRVHGLAGGPYQGVANIGIRPMFRLKRVLLEAHLFDFNQEIYGRPIRVELLRKLRDEAYYDSLDALVDQIRQDVSDAHCFFEGERNDRL